MVLVMFYILPNFGLVMEYLQKLWTDFNEIFWVKLLVQGRLE